MLTALLALVAIAAAPQDDPRAVAQRELDAWVAERDLPGASFAAVLPDGRLLAVASGLADREAGVALTPRHRMPSGSIGKTYFAVLVLRADARGELSLDDPLERWLGEERWFRRIPNARAVTLRQLMNHTSGIPEHVYDPRLWQTLRAAPDRVWSPTELAGLLCDREALFAPGEGWSYADANYLLLGIALERASGASVYELLREHVLEPHGLEGTLPADARRLPDLAQGYQPAENPFELPERMLVDGQMAFHPQNEWTGGGLVNTPTALAQWAHILFSGRALDAPYLDAMLDTVPASLGPGYEYGLGVLVVPGEGGPLIGHTGFFPGYVSAMGWFPELELAAALQVNTSDFERLGGRPEGPLRALARAVAAACAAPAESGR